MIRKIAIYSLFIVGIWACNDPDKDVANKYDNQQVGEEHDQVGSNDKDIDPNTIQGLHANIFKPTCANSGCHDGNFEPDYRTVESSYNTMVGQPIIKNDEMNPLTARVTPGNAKTSMLVRRMKVDLNGNSGIMPLVTEPGSDWGDKKDEYIKNIETWINNGALNQEGDAPTSSNYPVQLNGVAAKVGGNAASRSSFYNPINVSGSSVELWFSFSDDNLTPDQLSKLSLDLSIKANDFDSSFVQSLTYVATPWTTMGYLREDVDYHHKAVVDLSSWNSGDVIWVRTRVSDGVNDSEIPNDNSLFRAKQYATLRLN